MATKPPFFRIDMAFSILHSVFINHIIHFNQIATSCNIHTMETMTLDNQETTSPLAIVRGEAFTSMPKDLYIPPDAMEVLLEAFEGPLDLLLYLIKKQN